MNDPDPTKTPLHVYALRALVPTGVLVVAAMVAAQSGDDGSVLPGAPPTAPAAPTAPVRGTADGRKTPPARPHRRASLEIVALRAGPGPYPWGRGGRIARSFITDTPEVLEVVAQARFKSEPALLSGVRWEVTPPTGFTVPADATLEGAKLIVRLRRAEGNPSGGGEPLALAVTATLASGGTTHRETATLQQDLRDRLRQEYVDLERAYVPSRNALLDEMEFRKRYGRKYRSVQFAELNKTKQPGRAEQYPYILAEEALVGALHRAEREYGRPLNITSGFRNPVRQVEVHASVGESHHQYGRAADLYVPPDSVHPGTRQRIASELDWFRLASAALRGGGVWIEPMLACHVNTDGCHVHVDVRERGTPSRVVRVRGRVTDPSGNPIAGATVRLAGMPAITSASGAYSLKHVLTPRQYELQVEAPGRGATTQAVAVGGGETQVSVRLQADPQPTLVARADPARAGAGPLTVRVALKNVGMSPAWGLRVAAAGNRAYRVAAVQPAEVRAVAPGAETQFEVRFAAAGARGKQGAGQVPLQLTATYRTPAGAARTQTLPVQASVSAPAPAPARRTGAVATASPLPPAKAAPTTPLVVSPKGGPDAGAAATGLAIGGAAAAARALARRKGKPAPAPSDDSSVDPAQAAPAKEPAVKEPAKEPPAKAPGEAGE